LKIKYVEVKLFRSLFSIFAFVVSMFMALSAMFAQNLHDIFVSSLVVSCDVVAAVACSAIPSGELTFSV